MKTTWKRRAIKGDVAAIIEGASSVSAAARSLGVNRATVHRWISAGDVPRPCARRNSAHVPNLPASPLLPVSAEAWAADIRERYSLSSTENLLVELGAAALRLALDATQKASDRASASREFRACITQLNLETVDGEAETAGADVRAFPRPA
jgi:transposase-like protein